MNKTKVLKVAGGIIAGVALVGAGVTGGFLWDNPDTIIQNITKEVIVEKNITVDVPFETIVEKNVTVEKLVDNGNLDLVLEEIYDNEGSVEYLTEDLDEDEVSEIVERIVFANEVKALAVAEVKSEIADLVNKEVVNGTELDEDDVEKVRVNDDDDEVSIDDVDYDEKDAEVTVTGTIRVDDIWYDFETSVEIEDNEVVDVDLTSLTLN
jgi:hypothetical protein